MNIKEHIEAGHYAPGARLVPMRNGRIAVVYTTEHGGAWPIAGSVADEGYVNGRGLCCWQANGRIASSGDAPEDLMPPPPRKMKVAAWAIIGRPSDAPYAIYKTGDAAKESQRNNWGEAVTRIIFMMGEYSESWS